MTAIYPVSILCQWQLKWWLQYIMFQLYDADNISTEDWREWTQSRRRIYSFDKTSSSILSALKPQRKSFTKLHVIALEFFNFRFFCSQHPVGYTLAVTRKQKLWGKNLILKKSCFFKLSSEVFFWKVWIKRMQLAGLVVWRHTKRPVLSLVSLP